MATMEGNLLAGWNEKKYYHSPDNQPDGVVQSVVNVELINSVMSIVLLFFLLVFSLLLLLLLLLLPLLLCLWGGRLMQMIFVYDWIAT